LDKHPCPSPTPAPQLLAESAIFGKPNLATTIQMKISLIHPRSQIQSVSQSFRGFVKGYHGVPQIIHSNRLYIILFHYETILYFTASAWTALCRSILGSWSVSGFSHKKSWIRW
jgi:hypothetical protein